MKGLREKCKEIYYDNTGSAMIEAAIYYPIIIIAVLVVVMLSLFKLDKIMTQTNLSIKTKDVQIEMAQEDVFTYKYIHTMENNAELNDRRTLKVRGSSSRVADWVIGGSRKIYPVVAADYESHYTLDFMGVIPKTTSHGFMVKHNPQNVSLSMRDVGLYQDIISKKTGYSYEDYLKMQYGY